MGGIAVFITDNELGATALLAIGIYFTIVSALGRFPRIKLGENEIDPNAVAAAAAQSGADRAADAAAKAALERKAPEEVAKAARDVEENLRRSAVVILSQGTGKTDYMARLLNQNLDRWTWMDEKAADDTDRGD